MDTTKYLIALLEKVSDETLPVRKDIIVLLQLGILGDSFVNVLSSLFLEAHTKAHTLQEQQQIQQSLSIIEKIKHMESNDHQKDVNDIEVLDRMLESI